MKFDKRFGPNKTLVLSLRQVFKIVQLAQLLSPSRISTPLDKFKFALKILIRQSVHQKDHLIRMLFLRKIKVIFFGNCIYEYKV